MIQYIKDYIRLFWHIHICEGLKGKGMNRSIVELARNANPDYRAKKGGKWFLIVNGMVATYESHQFWVPENNYRHLGADKVLGTEEYRSGELYRRSYLANPHLNNKTITEYIK